MDSIRATFWKVLCFERVFFSSSLLELSFLSSSTSSASASMSVESWRFSSVDNVTTYSNQLQMMERVCACEQAYLWCVHNFFSFFAHSWFPFFLSQAHKMCVKHIQVYLVYHQRGRERAHPRKLHSTHSTRERWARMKIMKILHEEDEEWNRDWGW